MKTENSNAIGTPLRTALLLALSLSGAMLVSGCNKPVEEPPVPTEEVTPPPTETPPPAPIDQNPEVPPPADDPAATPAPTDSDAPPSGG